MISFTTLFPISILILRQIIRLRSEINNSTKSNKKLSAQYGVSEKTVQKWKTREYFTDKCSRPETINYALDELEQFIAINLRSIIWWSLDEITELSFTN